MLFFGVFRIFFCALVGIVAASLLPQYTSAAAVLKNKCPPDDYLCNHIFQLKLETHGLISVLERRFPDLVNGEQHRDQRKSDVGPSEVKDGNIVKLEEVSMNITESSTDISEVPMNNSLKENATMKTTADSHGFSFSTSQTPSAPIERSTVILIDQVTSSTNISDHSEQQVKTSTSTTVLSVGDHMAETTQHETPEGASTPSALLGQSTARPVPTASPDADDSVSQVDAISTKPPASVTGETPSRGTSTASPTEEEERSKTSSVSNGSTSKPVPATIGRVDINGGYHIVGTTERSFLRTTDTKEKSSTQLSTMSAKSTKQVALDEHVPSKNLGNESISKSPSGEEGQEMSSPPEKHSSATMSSTIGDTKVQTSHPDITARGQASFGVDVSTKPSTSVTSFHQFSSERTQSGTSPLNIATTTTREQDEEGGSTATESIRSISVSSKQPIASTDATDTLHQTTSSTVYLTSVPRDKSSSDVSRYAGTSQAVTETEYVSSSGDTYLVVPTDVAEPSTVRVSSPSTQGRDTTSAEDSAPGPLSESAADIEGNVTVIEGKWTAHYNIETSETELTYTEIVTEVIELDELPETTSGVNVRDATTRRALEILRSDTTQASPTPHSMQTTEVAIESKDVSTSSPEMVSIDKDVTIVEDELDVTFVTIIDDIADTYVTTETNVPPTKFVSTETIDDTEIIDEIHETEETEIDLTTIVYEEEEEEDEDEFVSPSEDITTERDIMTDKPLVTDKDASTHVPTSSIPPSTQEPTTSPPGPPRDCDDIWNRGIRESDIYTIFPNAYPGGFQVFCDLHDMNGGWTVIQRRVNGSVNFYRSWFDYFLGFGDLRREFYLGNEKIHQLTKQKKYELSILLWDFENESRYARYQTFRLGDYMSNYELSVRGYTGNAGNALGHHSRGRFSTFDRDFDDNPAVNCALMYGSGWWFKDCDIRSNLNGHYLRGENTQQGRGITWKKWKGLGYSLRYSEMRIKPNGL